MKPVNNKEKLIEIRPSQFGNGLFSLRDIQAGTVVCPITGAELNFKETLLLGEIESHCIQVDIDRYILCDPPFLYSNHSCAPNCAINANLELYTLIDIPKNTELLWDYSTSMYERSWTMPCKCGNKNCRKVIRDFDLLPEDLQQCYLKKNIVMPFIMHQFDADKKLLSTRA